MHSRYSSWISFITPNTRRWNWGWNIAWLCAFRQMQSSRCRKAGHWTRLPSIVYSSPWSMQSDVALIANRKLHFSGYGNGCNHARSGKSSSRYRDSCYTYLWADVSSYRLQAHSRCCTSADFRISREMWLLRSLICELSLPAKQKIATSKDIALSGQNVLGKTFAWALNFFDVSKSKSQNGHC